MANTVGFKARKLTQFEPDSTSESETEEPDVFDGNDALLGGLRAGLNTIRKHTRQTLADCESEEICRDMADRIGMCTLKLMRQEKSYLQTSEICVGIVDDVTAELEEIEELESGGNGDGINPNITTALSAEVIISTREKMSKLLDERLELFNKSFTDEDLKTQPQYIALQNEIRLGHEDFERKQNHVDSDEDVFLVAANVWAKCDKSLEFDEESSGEEQQ